MAWHLQVALRHQLSDVAALVRYARRPQWLGIEWASGGPPALYVTPARDALAAALLDAAQVRGLVH
jgi:DNAJ protein RME-8 N-terminal